MSAGANYEAHIFHALHTAQVMLVVCFDPANLAATWVQSEWQRYLELADAQQGHLVPLLYSDMPVSKLPQPFRRRKLEGIRMGEMECLVETVARYCGKKEQPKPAPLPQQEPPNPEPPKPEPQPEPAKSAPVPPRPEPPNPAPEPMPVRKYAPESDFEIEEVEGGWQSPNT